MEQTTEKTSPLTKPKTIRLTQSQDAWLESKNSSAIIRAALDAYIAAQKKKGQPK